jgi:PAS domain S-box-containing protein
MKQKLDEVIKILDTLKEGSINDDKIKTVLNILKNENGIAEFKDIFEFSPNAIIIHSENIITHVNQAALDFYGYKNKTELIGKSALETIVYKDDIGEVITTRDKLNYKTTATISNVRHPHKNGWPINTETHISKLIIDNLPHIQLVSIDIRERLTLEAEALEKKILFQNLFENSPDAIFVHNFKQITNVNNKFLTTFEYATKSEIIGNSPIENLIHPIDYLNVKNGRNSIDKNGIINFPEIRFLKKNGTIFHAATYASAILIDGKKHLQIVVRDITEIKKVKKKAVMFNQVIEHSFNEVYILEPTTLKFIEVNNAAINNLGYTIDEIKKIKLFDIISSVDKDKVSILINSIMNGQSEEVTIETIHIRKNGSKYPVEAHLQKLEFDDSPLLSVTAIDITKRQKKTLALQKSEEKHKGIVDTMIDVFVRINHLALIEMASPSVKLLGYSNSEVKGEPVINFYVNPLHVDDFFNEVMKKGQIVDFETQLLAKNGTVIDALISGKIYIDDYGKQGIESVIKNITEFKNQQHRLSENQSLLAAINENSPDYITIINKDFKIIYINKVTFGLTLEDVVGADILTFAVRTKQKTFETYLAASFKGEKKSFNMELYKTDGSLAYFSLRTSPIIKNKKIDSLLITATDITEQYEIIKQNEIINSISQKLNTKINVTSFCDFVFAELQNIKPFTDVYISNYDTLTKKTSVFYQIKNGELVDQLPEARIAGKGLSEYILKSKTGLILNNEVELLDFHKKNGLLIYKEQAKSWIGVPLISEDKIVGVLASQSLSENNYYTASDLSLFSFIGTQLGSIIEREKTEKELLAQKERLTLATSSSKMGVFDWDIKPNTLIWDDLMYETFGMNKDDFTDNFEAWYSSLHPDDAIKSQADIDMALQGLREFNTEFRIVLPDKSIRYIQGLGKVLRNKKNEPYRMVGLNWDISEQKRTALMTQGIADIQDSFITAEDPSESFEKMLNIILEVTDSETGFIGEVDYNKGVPYLKTRTIKNTYGYKEATKFDNHIPENGKEFPNLKVLFNEVLSTGEAVIKNKPIDNNRQQGITNAHPSLSNFIGIPFYFKDTMLGMIGIANKPQGFKQEDLDRLKPFITTCSTLIKAHQDTLKRNEVEEKLVVMADIVANSNDAIISTNTLGEIISWNNGAEKLLGYTTDEIIGQSISKLRPKVLEDIRKNMVKDVQNGKIIEGFETIQVHKNGKNVNVDMSIFPLADTEGNITGVSSILRDIEERIEITKIKEEFTTNLEDKVKERTIDLERAKKELAVSLEKEKILNDLKSKFVSTASHQFRTPLSVIQAGIGLLELQKSDMSDRLQVSFDKTYKRVTSQILKMTSLMDEVLTLGNINNANKKAIFKAVDLVKLCESTVNTYNEIQEDNRSMSTIVTGKRHTINLDENLMEHAVSNLISNSFKFSKGRNAPILTINFSEFETQLCITDYGIGIPEKDLTHFLDPFFRASNVEGISGTGLGTAIAKEYIALNNGTIEVTSKVNIGTEFVITFKMKNEKDFSSRR